MRVQHGTVRRLFICASLDSFGIALQTTTSLPTDYSMHNVLMDYTPKHVVPYSIPMADPCPSIAHRVYLNPAVVSQHSLRFVGDPPI